MMFFTGNFTIKIAALRNDTCVQFDYLQDDIGEMGAVQKGDPDRVASRGGISWVASKNICQDQIMSIGSKGRGGIRKRMNFYNHRCLHFALGGKRPP